MTDDYVVPERSGQFRLPPDHLPTVGPGPEPGEGLGRSAEHSPTMQGATGTQIDLDPTTLAEEKSAGGWTDYTRPVGGGPGPRDTSSSR